MSPAVQNVATLQPQASVVVHPRSWDARSLLTITLAWLLLQIGGLFSPGLLDDVDSIYIEIAREMLHRHDYVTPYINGIRFFDKPPLMYWMASGSMAVFGEVDWAARLPLALSVLALLFAVYGLGNRLFSTPESVGSSARSDRGGLYSALAVATGIGPYLYTRFYIPDILIALWMTLGVHLFLIALDRLRVRRASNPLPEPGGIALIALRTRDSALLPCLAFAAVLALNLLTKGLIGLIFPIGFILLYLTLTGQLRLLRRLHPVAGTLVFLVIAVPWHILAALRNPAIPLPSGLGLPASAGWAWFYLYNEHFARFLGRRIPHDYGNTPVWLFWLYLAVWMFPWTTFLPGALREHVRNLGHRYPVTLRQRETALTLMLWTGLVLGFFSFSSRQEYYSLPAIPALALMAGGLLARAEGSLSPENERARSSALRWTLWVLVPVTTLVAAVCGYFALTAPYTAPGTDIATLLAGDASLYNLSLGHIFDLTGVAMGLFRAPLAGVAVSMLAAGIGSYLLRRVGRLYAANLTLAGAMIVTLTCAHEGLTRFYPTLGSEDLALAVARHLDPAHQPGDLVLLDGEYTSGSTLAFYTRSQVHLLNGRVNTLWYGSFWPDAPQIFENEASLRTLWASDRRIFLFTYNPAARSQDLATYGPIHTLARAGGKTILTNH